jgi:hypothetical protein
MDAAAEDIVAGAGAAVQDAQPPPKRSSSPEEETDCRFFKFIVLITEDPFCAKILMEKFVQFLVGRCSPKPAAAFAGGLSKSCSMGEVRCFSTLTRRGSHAPTTWWSVVC